MKRITAFMLSIILAFSSLGVVFAETADNSGEVERALSILKAIGQFADYDMATVEQNKEITRGEFAQGLAELLQLTASEGKLYYHDVSKEHFAYDGITAITEAGYAGGYGDNLFKPDNVMTKYEAAIVLTSALGYKTEAVAGGGTEAAYVKIASRLELLDGTVSNDALIFGDMLIMFKNALTAPLVKVRYSGTDTIYEESDENLLSMYYDCYYSEKERVIYANNTGIYAEARSDGKVVIGNDEYIPISEDMGSYLGSYVDFIYKGDPEETVPQIVWIEKNDRYKEITLYEDDIDGFNSNNYTYQYYNENGKRKSITLSRNISVIYNGRFENDAEKFLELPCTEIRFVANKEGDYDTAIISNYENYVIDSVYMADEVFTVRQGNERISIAENDYDELIILNEELNVISVDDLVADATVSMFKSSDGRYLKLILSQKTSEGIIEALSVDPEDFSTVTVNGTEYKLSSGIDTDSLYVGKNAFIYLDYNNKISYIKKDYAYGYMAYIINAGFEAGLDEVKIKAFNQDGEIKVYDTAKVLTVDNIRYKEPDSKDFNNFKNIIDEQLVLLEFDDEGKIRNIDTAQGDGDLTITAPFASCNYRGVSPKMGKLTLIDSSTKIFSVPAEPKTANQSEFKIKAKGELGDWRVFYAQAYQYTDDTDYASAVLIEDFKWNAPTDSSLMFVYEKSYEAVNDDDETVTVLKGMEGVEEKEYFCEYKYTPPELSVGDAVFLELNGNGEICGMEPVFDRDSEGGESNTNLVAARRMIIGYVNKINGNVISIGYTDPGVIDEKFDCTGTPIVIVDESKGKDCVTTGTIADIISYENSLVEYSKVGIHTHQMSQKVIVVYK